MSALSVASPHAELFEALGPLATALAEAVKQRICLPGAAHVPEQPYDHALGTGLEQAAVLALVGHLRALTSESQHLRNVLGKMLEAPAPTQLLASTSPSEPQEVVEAAPAEPLVASVAVDEPVWQSELCPEPLPEPEFPKVDPNAWLNLSTVASRLSLSIPYVRMLCRVGKLGEFSAGDDDWFVRHGAVQAFQEAARSRRGQLEQRRARPRWSTAAAIELPEPVEALTA